jgi:integrase
VACYLTDLALQGRKVSTLTQHLAAISFEHQGTGYATPSRSPVVRHVITGIRRSIGVAPHQVDALYTEDIQRMVATLPNTLIGKRDRALLLLGFAGAFRRSELVALNIDDLQFRAEGLCVRLSRSKTDQEGLGRLIGIPYGQYAETCPVLAVRIWLDDAHITEGAVFRGMSRHDRIASERLSKRAVADVVKRTAKAAGLNPTQVSGHSLRAGHCTTAARAGVSEHVIMQQTGHKSLATLHRYIRQGSLFQENSAASLGL